MLSVRLSLAVEKCKIQRASGCRMSIQCTLSGGAQLCYAFSGTRRVQKVAADTSVKEWENTNQKKKAVRTGRDLHNMLVSSLVPQDWKLLEC